MVNMINFEKIDKVENELMEALSALRKNVVKKWSEDIEGGL